MLIEIDKSVLDEAKKGNQTAFDVLNDLATAQRKGYHALWADGKILDGIMKLSKNKLGDNLKIYCGLSKAVRIRKAFYNFVTTKVLVTFNEDTHRDGNVIYIKPSSNKPLPFVQSTLLSEHLNDGDMFEYILLWYMRKHNLTHPYSIDKQMGGGSGMAEVYIEYAEKKKDRFCLCIADSDIKADVKKLLDNNLITPSHCPKCGNTFKKIEDYDKAHTPFNCACYCFERVMEIENLIPFNIIANDSNYKHTITGLHHKTDLSFFDFKEGLHKDSLNNAPQYLQKYWKDLIFSNNANILGQDTILEGFGDGLLAHTLDAHKAELSTIDDSMLSNAQKHEYEEIGKRVFSWCCSMSIARALL